ncbi:hypothetical protein PKHYL_17090 [Psychrobacter sp. KH172YL61]|nr:hypothetical protein PKHYL_17090 [Psychrobacter sp. KH172YL61]
MGKTTPAERAAVMYKVVSILDQRQDEIVDWLIKESGSTRIKAMVEFSSARAITLEAASFPNRVHGEIRPSNTPWQRKLYLSRAHRSGSSH